MPPLPQIKDSSRQAALLATAGNRVKPGCLGTWPLEALLPARSSVLFAQVLPGAATPVQVALLLHSTVRWALTLSHVVRIHPTFGSHIKPLHDIAGIFVAACHRVATCARGAQGETAQYCFGRQAHLSAVGSCLI